MHRNAIRARPSMAVCGAVFVGLLAPSVADARYGAGTLERGDSGRDVKILQKYLTKAGIETTADGEFGTGTVKSLKKFERGAQLRVDGKLQPRDAKVLKRVANDGAEGGAPEDGDSDGNGGATPGAPGSEAEGDGAPAAATGKVTISEDGRTATAPADAPQEVKDAVAAANKITDTPYKYGGGHGDFEDTGYDCSGAVSYALHGADLLDTPLDSSGLAGWGEEGEGQWITVYGKSSHAYIVIGGARFDTSGEGEEGPRWRHEERSPEGYSVRHPEGL